MRNHNSCDKQRKGRNLPKLANLRPTRDIQLTQVNGNRQERMGEKQEREKRRKKKSGEKIRERNVRRSKTKAKHLYDDSNKVA